MQVTRAMIITEARQWLDTPFHHQGRTRRVGVDCAGLVIGVAQFLRLSDYDVTAYPHRPDGVTLRRLLRENMIEKPFQERQPGDVVLFAIDGPPQHLAILTGIDSIIHAYAQARKVIEQPFDEEWQQQLRGVYAYKGVTD